MANYISSNNMGLPLPIVGVDPGPDYANNQNAAFLILDSHSHSAGSGVPITPAGLNISADLSFISNNATNLRSVRFSPQVSVLNGSLDLGCLYESGVDLYFNDGAGNKIRITQSGGIAGSPGSISNLTSPASASYVAGNNTFVWQSAASTPANLDAASVIFRNLSANSNGVTLSPPASLASNYGLTLPVLPTGQSFMTLDNYGNMAAPTAYPLTSSGIASATIQGSNIASGTITGSNLASATVTGSNIAATTITAANIQSQTITAGQIANTNYGTTAGIAPGQLDSASGGYYAISSAVNSTVTCSTTPTAVSGLNITMTSATGTRPTFLHFTGTFTSDGNQIVTYTVLGKTVGGGTIYTTTVATFQTQVSAAVQASALNCVKLPPSLPFSNFILELSASGGSYPVTLSNVQMSAVQV